MNLSEPNTIEQKIASYIDDCLFENRNNYDIINIPNLITNYFSDKVMFRMCRGNTIMFKNDNNMSIIHSGDELINYNNKTGQGESNMGFCIIKPANIHYVKLI